MSPHTLRRLRLRRPSTQPADAEELPGHIRVRSAPRLPPSGITHWTAKHVQAVQHRAGNREAVRAIAIRRGDLSPRYLSPETARAVAVMRWPLVHGQRNIIRRITVPRTTTTDADWQRVPDDHLARVQAAVRIINSKITSRRLINYFRDHAPGGTTNTLQQVANRARIWELRTAGSMGLSVQGGNDMAYDTYVYRLGRWQIAATLMHEMMHLAGVSSSARDEASAENAIDAARLYAPFIQWVRPRRASPGDTVTIGGISFGPSQGSVDRVTIGGVDVGRVLSWRWRHAGQGQIRFRVPRNVASGSLVVENNTVRSNTVPLTVVPEAEGTEAAPAPAPTSTEAAPAPEAAD